MNQIIELERAISAANHRTQQTAAERDELRTRREAIDEMIKIQLTDGNWNYDSYMHGMANGLLVAQAVMYDLHDFEGLSAPDKWLCDRETPTTPQEAPAP